MFKKNSFISQNHWSFTKTRVIGIENKLWKFELDPIIFLDCTETKQKKKKRKEKKNVKKRNEMKSTETRR